MAPKRDERRPPTPGRHISRSSSAKEKTSAEDERRSSETATPLPTAPSETSNVPSSSAGTEVAEQSKQEKNTATRSHKRHKSWDPAATTPTLAPQEPYPRSRSTSPLKHGIREEEEEGEEREREPHRRTSGTSDKGFTSLPPLGVNAQSAADWIRDIVGISVDEWPYSQELLTSAVSLKLEQQKTRTATLKLTSLQTTMDMVKLALDSNIPPHLIPYMIASGEISRDGFGSPVKEEHKKSTQRNTQTATSVFKVNIPQQTQFQFHHWQKPGEPKGDFKDDRKRKSSADESATEPAVSSQTRPPPPHQFKPTTPTRRAANPNTHRRNQSEANVSHLRSLYEGHSQQHHEQQQPVPQQIPQRMQPIRAPVTMQQYPPPHPHWPGQVPSSLGSPYLPPRDSTHPQQRPLYYQYQQPPPPSQAYGPAPGYQFPRREAPPPLQTPMHPPPIPTSATSSPVSSHKKGDVSFLISTPTNPPK